MRSIGTIVFWNREKGWGFAEISSPVEDQPGVEIRDAVFLHYSDLGGKIPHLNDIVTFEIEPSSHPKHKWRGRNVRIVRLAEQATTNASVVETVQP